MLVDGCTGLAADAVRVDELAVLLDELVNGDSAWSVICFWG